MYDQLVQTLWDATRVLVRGRPPEKKGITDRVALALEAIRLGANLRDIPEAQAWNDLFAEIRAWFERSEYRSSQNGSAYFFWCRSAGMRRLPEVVDLILRTTQEATKSAERNRVSRRTKK